MSQTPFRTRHAESQVIGGAAQDVDACLAVDLVPADFENPAARRLWQSMLDLAAGDGWRGPNDLCVKTAATEDEMRNLGRYLDDAVITAAPRDVPPYAREVKQSAVTRNALRIASEASALVERGIEGEDLTVALIDALTRERSKLVRAQSLTGAELALSLIDLITNPDAEENSGIARYVPTGLGRIDDAIAGWQGGVVSVVGARTSHGKSAFILQCALHAISLGVSAHILSAEDLEADTGFRLLGHLTGLAASDLRKYRRLEEHEVGFVAGARDSAEKLAPLRITPAAGLNARQLCALVKLHQRRDGTGIVFFDYLQRLPRQRGTERYEIISDAMDVFDCAAKESGIPWVVASQLKRSQNKYPTLADFREAGTIEEIAKTAIGLHRPAKGDYHDDRMWIGVLKSSNDDCFAGEFGWDGPTMTIANDEPTRAMA